LFNTSVDDLALCGAPTIDMTLGELRKIIKESHAENVISDRFDFEGVVHSLPLRNEEDTLRLLPYVMSQSLYLIERGDTEKLQALETAIRLFSNQASAEKLQSLMNPAQRTCMVKWLLFLKESDYIDYVERDFDECMKFW